MKRLLLASGLLFAGAATAHAGVKYWYPVEIDTKQRSASGSLGSARNSADTVQQIECLTFDGGGVCYARTAGNQFAACSFNTPGLQAIAQSVSGDSHVTFQWDEVGMCTNLFVRNGSAYEPKKP